MKARICLLFCTCLLSATALEAETPESFLSRAETVFVGRVVEQRSSWDSEGRLIWTDHIFEVREWLKGAERSVMVVRELGGTVGQTTLTVSHGPSYRPDSSYLVFLSREFEGRTLDGEAGRFQVMDDGQGGSFIRLYSQHPLSSLSDSRGQSLLELESLSSKLRQRLEK